MEPGLPCLGIVIHFIELTLSGDSFLQRHLSRLAIVLSCRLLFRFCELLYSGCYLSLPGLENTLIETIQ